MKISEAGIVDGKGRLLLPQDRLNQEARRHRGYRVIATFEFVEPGSSEAQQAYYEGYVLPTIQQAIRNQGTIIGIESLDRQLLGLYPGDLDENGMYPTRGRQLNMRQMSDFLDWLQQFAAENYETYIEDPTNI